MSYDHPTQLTIEEIAEGPAFKVGDVVCRIEDREQVRATVLELCDQETVHISYHEGGHGYWSCSSLRLPTAEELQRWGLAASA